MASACGVSNHLFPTGTRHHQWGNCLFCYSKILPPFKTRKLRDNSSSSSSSYPTTCRYRFQSVHKSDSDKNSSTLPQCPPQESPVSDSDTQIKFPDYNGVQKSSIPSLFSRFREEFKMDQLGLEILSIAMPAALALLADPIASLVDSAFIGHLGSVELAAVGVSVSVFNLVSKLFNVPLLNITTSFVAEEQALLTMGAKESTPSVHEGKLLLPSVSTSLVLAAGLGIAEAIALSVGSGFLMNTMGITADSPMRTPAEQFLSWRAFGAPPIVIALAAQGTFRGFKDTKTPLYAVGAGNLLNAVLDPILIFFFHIGIGGAAAATVISEYLIALILLLKLNDKVLLVTPNIDGGRFARYLKSGSLLIGRTIAVLATTTVATSMAARLGPIPMAGHEICFQVWLAISLLTDALALAGQALLASGFSQGSYNQARQVVYKILQIGSVTGLALAVVLFFGFGAVSNLFSVDSEVLEIARSGTLFVAASQPMNAIAFVIDGLYYGVSDFGYAAYSMVVIGFISVVFLIVATPSWGLAGVWAGLFLFMALRVVAGILRMTSRTGPWKLLWSNVDHESS